MAWTDEKIDRLKYLCSPECKVKMSAADMAYDLGTSRNAVIGKAKRLGLQLPGHLRVASPAEIELRRLRRLAMRAANERQRWGRRREAGVKSSHYSRSKFTVAAMANVPDIDDLAIPPEQRTSILELTDHTCRYPVGHPGEPGFFYCGGVPLEGHSYCPGHWRRTHEALRGFAKPFRRPSATAAIAALLTIPPEAIPVSPVAA